MSLILNFNFSNPRSPIRQTQYDYDESAKPQTFNNFIACFNFSHSSLFFSACYQIGDVVNEAAAEATQQPPIRTPKQTAKLNAFKNSTYQTATDELLKAYNWTLISAEVQGAPIHSYENIIKNRAGELKFSNRGLYF